jgi:DNA-binding CsgD family transcriptional regulator
VSGDLRAALAPLVTRNWPVDRMLTVYAERSNGLTMERIADRLDLDPDTVRGICHRMTAASVLEKRNPGWTDDRRETFIELYNQGLDLAEIARRMGISKNAAVGQSHRLIDKGLIAARPRAAGNVTDAERARRLEAAAGPNTSGPNVRPRLRRLPPGLRRRSRDNPAAPRRSR